MFVLAHTKLNFSVGAVTLQPFIKSCVYRAPYLRPPCLTHHYRLACVVQTTHVNIYSANIRKNIIKQNYCLIKPIVRQTTLYHKTIINPSHHNYILLTIPDYVDNRTMCQDRSHGLEVSVDIEIEGQVLIQ